jgi:hypothetical protein
MKPDGRLVARKKYIIFSLQNQINFLRTHLFTKEWNHFEKLALMGYNAEDKTTPITDFGRLKNLDDIESFVQSLQQVALCIRLLGNFPDRHAPDVCE